MTLPQKRLRNLLSNPTDESLNPFSLMLFLHHSSLLSNQDIPKEFSFPRKSIISEMKYTIIFRSPRKFVRCFKKRSHDHCTNDYEININVSLIFFISSFILFNKIYILFWYRIKYFTYYCIVIFYFFQFKITII